MKLKTRIAVLTSAVLLLCCILLFCWASMSTRTMVKNIRLLEDQKYARLQSIELQEQLNMQRLLAGLCTVVLIGGGVSYCAADIALKPVRRMTGVIRDYKSGDLKSEIPLPSVKDEAYDLILAFNQMTGRLNQAFEREKRVTANIAHEFRTPLAVLMTKYEVLEITNPVSMEPYRKAIEVSKEKVEYLSDITTKLLSLYRDTLEDNREVFDLKDMLQNILKEFRDIAAKSNISLILNCPELKICADPVLLRQMISNFIDNAIRYNTLNGSVSVEVLRKPCGIKFKITDTGIGISDENKTMLFEPFYRVEKSRSHQHGGTGLGLAFAKNVVELYNGEIEVQDNCPQGCIFTIRMQMMICNNATT
ncbi:MAG: sensor histidine kinase [Candidatus Limivicinus sp.]|jgi:signal transduction histidine kinase